LLIKFYGCDLADDHLLHDAVKCERGSCPEFESWIGSGKKAIMCYEHSGGMWGLALMNNILVESVIPFSEKIEDKEIKKTFIYKE
jgi:hypothetical protein